MPLPSDQKLVELGEQIIQQFDTIFGLHPGFRPAHAKGELFTGTFTPSAKATQLTNAPHATRPSTPIYVRFSDSTGLPTVPDTVADTNPHGMAIRFQLGEREHTDIISHSADGFPTRTGAEFLQFPQAAVASANSKTSPTPIEAFLGSHPETLAFVQMPKPFPVSFAQEAYFGVTAFRFTNAEGVTKFGRYRIVPEAPIEHLDEAAVKTKSDNFLFDEITERVKRSPVLFKIYVQIAGDEDVTDNATVHWPENREQLEFGTLEISAVAEDNAAKQKYMIFDPIPRVTGIEPSDDPLLELRAAIYLLSGRRRRSAPAEQAASAS